MQRHIDFGPGLFILTLRICDLQLSIAVFLICMCNIPVVDSSAAHVLSTKSHLSSRGRYGTLLCNASHPMTGWQILHACSSPSAMFQVFLFGISAMPWIHMKMAFSLLLASFVPSLQTGHFMVNLQTRWSHLQPKSTWTVLCNFYFRVVVLGTGGTKLLGAPPFSRISSTMPMNMAVILDIK